MQSSNPEKCFRRNLENKTNSKSQKRARTVQKNVGFKPPSHYRMMPNSDARYTYIKRFCSFKNSADVVGMREFLLKHAVVEVVAAHLYDGEQNPYGPNIRETVGIDSLCAVWNSILKMCPDYLFEVFTTTAHFDPATNNSFVSSQFRSSFTKVFDISPSTVDLQTNEPSVIILEKSAINNGHDGNYSVANENNTNNNHKYSHITIESDQHSSQQQAQIDEDNLFSIVMEKLCGSQDSYDSSDAAAVDTKRLTPDLLLQRGHSATGEDFSPSFSNTAMDTNIFSYENVLKSMDSSSAHNTQKFVGKTALEPVVDSLPCWTGESSKQATNINVNSEGTSTLLDSLDSKVTVKSENTAVAVIKAEPESQHALQSTIGLTTDSPPTKTAMQNQAQQLTGGSVLVQNRAKISYVGKLSFYLNAELKITKMGYFFHVEDGCIPPPASTAAPVAGVVGASAGGAVAGVAVVRTAAPTGGIVNEDI